MNIIIFGPPLAGKGTQSKHILNDFDLTHLSTGDALRAEKVKGTALGLEAAEYSKKGLLAPDELVSKVVESFIAQHGQDKGILFDGYPRNTDQAKHLMSVLEKTNAKIDKIIFLKVKEEELLKRAEKRALAENREDDKDSNTVRRRIKEFSTSTIPAIEWLQTKDIPTIEIDGNKGIEEIYSVIVEALK